jgi:CheY-like chemotaxis protein
MNRPPKKAVVLAVDDTPENLDVLTGALKSEFTVLAATSGSLALRIVASDPQPDIILLDIMMPEMDGYEVIRHLKADERTREIPVIFLTALTEANEELKGLMLGAVDYITKPFSAPIVKARIRSHLELRAAKAALFVQNQVLTQERELIEEIINLMPDAGDFDGRNLRWLSSSVDRTNGDCILSGFSPDRRQWLMVGDVAGHGPSAALGMPMVAEIFYRNLKSGTDVPVMLEELNRAMCHRLPTMLYMVFGFVEISPEREIARIWNGGLPGCARIIATNEITEFASLSTALGICTDFVIDETSYHTVACPPGSRLCLFTDGITELKDAFGEELGPASVLSFLARLGSHDPMTSLWSELERHYGGRNFPDDITVVELCVGRDFK